MRIQRLSMLQTPSHSCEISLAPTSALLLTLLFCLLSTSCTRSAEQDPIAEYPTPAPSQRMTQGELAEHYPSLNMSDVCVQDTRCDSPLRCIDGECRFPQAMTGDVDEQTPMARVETAAGEQVSYALELAQRPDELARGLMHRDHMQPDFGMLFIFPKEERQSFWMKNTRISLDMLFIRSDGVIDTIIERATPGSLVPRESRGKALYVLELIGGETAQQGIRAGDQVSFERLPSRTNP